MYDQTNAHFHSISFRGTLCNCHQSPSGFVGLKIAPSNYRASSDVYTDTAKLTTAYIAKFKSWALPIIIPPTTTTISPLDARAGVNVAFEGMQGVLGWFSEKGYRVTGHSTSTSTVGENAALKDVVVTVLLQL